VSERERCEKKEREEESERETTSNLVCMHFGECFSFALRCLPFIHWNQNSQNWL